MNLLNQDTIDNRLLNEACFSPSHGAVEGHLGTGIIYYSMVYMTKARFAVCLGSGDGFVPRLLRQAQIDAGIQGESETLLIDANLPELGWGGPDYFDKPEGVFRKYFDVKIMCATTKDAVFLLQNRQIDYLHIDADHSYEHVSEDFRLYSQFLGPNSVVTLHDTNADWAHGSLLGVPKLVRELHEDDTYDVIDFNNWWHGVAIIKPRRVKIAAWENGLT